MRDNDDCAVLLDGVDTVLDLLGGDGVKAGSRLVEEYDRRVLEEHSGNRHALLLSSGQKRGLGVESLREGRHLVEEVSLLGSHEHFCVSGVRLAVLDVLLDAAVEDMVLLEHETDVLAKEVSVVVAKVDSVELDGSAVRLVELVQEVDDGRLAGAAEAHECRDLAAVDMHIDVVQGLVAVGVGEVDTADDEVALDLLGLVAAGGLYLGVGVENVEVALGVDEGVVHIVEYSLELCDRGHDVAEEHHVVHDLAYGHPGIFDEHEVGGEDDDQHRADLLDEGLQTVVVEGRLADAHLVIGEPGLQVPLLIALDLLAVEALDDVDALDDAHYAVALDLPEVPHIAAPALELLGLADGDPEVDGDYEEGRESYIDVGGEDEDEGEDCAREEGQEVDEEVLHRAGEAAHTLVDTCLELAGGVLLTGEECHAEGEDLVHDGLAHILADEDAHALAVVVLGVGCEYADNFLAEKYGGDYREDAGGLSPVEIAAAGAHEGVDLVHRPVQHDGVDLCQEGADEGQDEGGENKPFVGLYIWLDLLE